MACLLYTSITVNAIAPGFIQTPWHENRTPESYERINRKIALHRFGEIKDVADMAYSILTCLLYTSLLQELMIMIRDKRTECTRLFYDESVRIIEILETINRKDNS